MKILFTGNNNNKARISECLEKQFELLNLQKTVSIRLYSVRNGIGNLLNSLRLITIKSYFRGLFD